jgi:GNAT superfamily N-acetyltransferase
MSRESDGAISGMTDVLTFVYEPGFVRQQFTGVHPSARGRGLGKWLKAAMLEHVRTMHPDTIYMTTENAASNASMLAINRALGFQLHRAATTYQFSREALTRRL